MSRATKLDQSMTTGPTPLGLIAREAKRLIDDGPYQPFKDDGQTTKQRHIVREILADTEHRCPEHVWGDEGPVNE